MEQTRELTQGLLGDVTLNGVPLFNHDGAPWTEGGIISTDNTAVAYFGRVVSEDPSALNEFLMGCADGDNVVGVLQNDYARNENAPVNPDYILAGLPATAIWHGPFWLESWTHVASGSRTIPVRGDTVIFKTDTGVIEFLPPGTDVPSGYKQLNASVKGYKADTNKVLIFMGVSDSEFVSSNRFESDSAHAISFENTTPGTSTTGTLISTGASWLSHATVGQAAVKLLCAYAAASGDYATLRIRARSDVAWTASDVGGVVAGNFSSSANIDNYGNLIAVQGYAQPNAFTQSDAGNILCGLYSCIDRTVATSGRSWSLWTDTHETVKASGGHYLHRLSNNGAGLTLDGIWSIYSGAGSTYLMNFESAAAPVAANTTDISGGSHALNYIIKVRINGNDGYIPILAAVPS